MTFRNLSSFTHLYWKKSKGCFREFGFLETIRRASLELAGHFRETTGLPDASPIAENLGIGAAPRSLNEILFLRKLGFGHIIDLRAERKHSDPLAKTRDVLVKWVPTYDDWRPKPTAFFEKLAEEIRKIVLLNGDKLFLCCGSGEHRAPLAGVMALVLMKQTLDTAISIVMRSRPKAELLPVYMKSLKQFPASNP